MAPFCALYVLEDQPSFLTRSGPLDESVVNVLISRDVPGDIPTETEQVMRSIRDAAQQGHPRVYLRIWYWGGSGWERDEEAAPTWPGDCGQTEWSAACTKADEWVENLLLPRLDQQPSDLATAFVDRVNDPSLRISSSAIKLGVQNKWSLRIDGLEIGVANERKVTLSIGKDHKGQTTGPGYERRIFIEVFGSKKVTVGRDGDSRGPDELTLDEAAEKIRTLLARFRRTGSGDWVIRAENGDGPDEGAWEARLLDGRAELEGLGTELVCDDARVIRGSQFPTLWQHPHRHRDGHRLMQKYLDAMVRDGRTPIAVELKAKPEWQLAYYRESFVQAVLYRHFIQKTPSLDPWFKLADLDRCAVRAVIAFPIPPVMTPIVQQQFAVLRQVGARFGVFVTFIRESH